MAEIFSERLKKIRESKKLSQSDLGKKTGLQSAAISHFETGQRKPSFDNLKKLADALSVSIDYLLGRDVTQSSNATQKLFRDFEKLSLDDQEVIERMAKVLLNKNQDK
jgi:transcriptional regulator with XRE-family HTH domain